MSKLRGWKFPVDVDKTTGKIMTVEDNDNVRQGIEIILTTQKGERKMRPSFGTDMNKFMFGSIDMPFMNQLSQEVSSSIHLWEKKITQLVVNAKQDAKETSRVNIEVEYMTDMLPTVEKVTKSIDKNDFGM